MEIDIKELDRLVPMNGFPIQLKVYNTEKDNPLYTNGKSEIFLFRRVIDINEILSVSGVTSKTNPSRYIIIENVHRVQQFCVNLDYDELYLS